MFSSLEFFSEFFSIKRSVLKMNFQLFRLTYLRDHAHQIAQSFNKNANGFHQINLQDKIHKEIKVDQDNSFNITPIQGGGKSQKSMHNMTFIVLALIIVIDIIVIIYAFFVSRKRQYISSTSGNTPLLSMHLFD